jgi:predicted kinase
MEVVIFIGLQATGKSTFYRQYFATTHELISKDLMSRRGKENRQVQSIDIALAANKSIVIDNTNPRAIDRTNIINQSRNYQVKIIGYYFASKVSESLERNSKRTGKALVPDVGIFSTAKLLVKPEYTEGFDELFYVQIGTETEFIITPWRKEETDGTEKF